MRPAVVVTLGGGGAYACGFHLGIARGLRDEGIDVARAPLMGTSGGSHAAVAIATGMVYADIVPAWQEYVDSVGTFWVRADTLAKRLYGTATLLDGASASGVCARTRASVSIGNVRVRVMAESSARSTRGEEVRSAQFLDPVTTNTPRNRVQ